MCLERWHRRGNVLFQLPAAVFSSLLPACVGGISTTACLSVLPTGQPASFPLRGPGSDVTPPPPLREGLPGTLGAERRPSHRPPQRRSQSQLCLCRCQWQQPSRAPSPPSHSVPPPNAGHCCRDNVQRRHRGQARYHCGRIGGVCVSQGKDAAGSQDRQPREETLFCLCVSVATVKLEHVLTRRQPSSLSPTGLPPALPVCKDFRVLVLVLVLARLSSWLSCQDSSTSPSAASCHPPAPPSLPEPFSFRLHFLSLISPSLPVHYFLLLVPDRPAASPASSVFLVCQTLLSSFSLLRGQADSKSRASRNFVEVALFNLYGKICSCRTGWQTLFTSVFQSPPPPGPTPSFEGLRSSALIFFFMLLLS